MQPLPSVPAGLEAPLRSTVHPGFERFLFPAIEKVILDAGYLNWRTGMKTEIVPSLGAAVPEVLLPWHKPEVQALNINLDTGLEGGSFPDGEFSDNGLPHSDIRLKTNSSRIKDALSGVLSLSGVTYSYNTAKYPELRLSDGPQIGFIAQELEQVYPELVKTKEDGFKAVNYAQLVPVLVEAIKEQQLMIEELKQQVNELRENSTVGTL